MNKTMFIADAQTWHPPFVHIGLVAIGHMDGTPAANDGLITMIKIFQSVQVMQVPTDGSMLTVDLESIQRFMASCITGGLKQTQ